MTDLDAARHGTLRPPDQGTDMSETRYPVLLHIDEDDGGRVTLRLEHAAEMPDGRDVRDLADLAHTGAAGLRVDLVVITSTDWETNFTDVDEVLLEQPRRQMETPPSSVMQQVVVCKCGRVGRLTAGLHWETTGTPATLAADDVPF